MSFTTRTTCRVCGSERLVSRMSLGSHYINDFPWPGKAYEGPKCPIDIFQCLHCTLVQNIHTARQELLYTGHYWYKSGTTETMRKALMNVVTCAKSEVILRDGDVVLDIGSNDGTLLRCYDKCLVTVGVEPATNLASHPQEGVHSLINDFWSAEVYWNEISRPAKIITAIGMFYDLDDPNQFIADVKKALHPDGVFIAQLMCLHNMLNVADLGNFAHEHLEFYTLTSLDYLLNAHGLEIYKIETNEVNGESYRLYIQHIGGCRETHPSVPQARYNEQGIEKRLHDFGIQMNINAINLNRFIQTQVVNGKSVWVYGASTKGNTILQYMGLNDRRIVAAVDKDKSKWGRVTVGTNIPITSEETMRKADPDFLLVLPYAFFDEFFARESEWHSKGGKFIIPLPEMRIV